ncbi:ABC transporter permease [Halanaerobium praevalens]|uniref:Binding-protein-dependent transport systems inner membrane component n=1 Tax=Halanaerobium praevalens (strain ATCC 33744 / DSM 2228 / GSL) TaxID=572479 RepID=E3DND6_HALPG|nr:ABC transporter permease subunit [Halanaerobium praevalens]ADO77555.1 binding-protein-dependent transport systems inner membrane component [Halanaerobium praevalens DSM 2228]
MKNKYRQRLLWLIILALIWQLIASAGIFSAMIFPGLDQIFRSLINSLSDGSLLKQIIFSFSIILQGLFLATVAALLLALISYFSTTAAGLIETLTALAHPLPGIALMPLILIWFGSGKNAILLVIIHSVLWPLILNLSTGFNSIPEIYTLIAKNYRLNKIDFMFKILIPASLPYFISGLKISWARSWRALISAEMLFGAVNSLGGLGWYIFQKRVFFDLPGVFAGIIVIIIIGVLVEDFVFKKIEKVTVKKWGMVK